MNLLGLFMATAALLIRSSLAAPPGQTQAHKLLRELDAWSSSSSNRTGAKLLKTALDTYWDEMTSLSAPQERVCGKRATPRIIGGENAAEGDFPWQAFLLVKMRDPSQNSPPNPAGKFQCGGTLISAQWVLTAGHCLEVDEWKPYEIYVTVGAIDLSSVPGVGKLSTVEHNQPHKGSHVTMRAIAWHPHPEFDLARILNDIGLVRIPPVDRTPGFDFMPACLPTATTDDSGSQDTIATGFGKTSDANNDISFRLKYITPKLLPLEKCKADSEFLKAALTEKMLCIDGQGGRKTICNGDSGGPLLLKDGDDYAVIGVASFGAVEECEAPVPSVFTRVKSYLDFICNTAIGACVK